MDEAALIHDAQRGDVDAYNGLVLHYQSQVFNVAYRIIGEHDAAADATQDAFIRAYKNLGRFRGGNFRAWLLRIVTNLCYDELRRRKRRQDCEHLRRSSPDCLRLRRRPGSPGHRKRRGRAQRT